MDEEKIADKILGNRSVARALYELGFLDELRRYLKTEYNLEIEQMIYKGLDKSIVLSYLKNKRKLISKLNDIETRIKSIRMKTRILSYIYVFTLSILTPIILIMNAITPGFISNNMIDTNILFTFMIIYGFGQIIIGEIIFSYISMTSPNTFKIIFKLIIFAIITYLLYTFYNSLFLMMLAFK